tara:strand:- start:1557 stop:1814 length:258 start_codon:yes stop_codon:yes gene_type:complete
MLIALHLSGSLGVFIKKKYVHAVMIADSSSFVKEEKPRNAESRKPSVFNGLRAPCISACLFFLFLDKISIVFQIDGDGVFLMFRG